MDGIGPDKPPKVPLRDTLLRDTLPHVSKSGVEEIAIGCRKERNLQIKVSRTRIHFAALVCKERAECAQDKNIFIG